PPNINHCCYECGDPLDGIFCKRCTCKSCGKDAHIGYNCPSKVPVISNPKPCNNQTINELPQTLPIFHPTFHSEAESPFTLDSTPTYVDESPNAPFIYPEPCYNQDFNFPQYFQDVPQQYTCCDDCGVTHEPYQCHPMNEVYDYGQNSCYDSTSIGFNQSQSQQYTINHPIFNAHKSCLDSRIQLNKEKQLEEEQAAKAQDWKPPVCCDDDDDEESSKSLKDNIISELPLYSEVTPNEPVDSLIMGDEHIDTIPATESDKFIKSGVENLIPILSESEDIPEHVCDVLSHDNSLPLDVSKDQIEDFSESNEEFSSTDDDSFSFDDIDYVEASPPDSELVSSEVMEIVLPETKSSSTSLNSLLEETNNFHNSLPECTTFSHVLCDAECESDSSDDQSPSDKDVLETIISKPMYEEEIIPMKSLRTHDSSLPISSKIDSFLEEFAGELTLLKSIPSGIDETDCDFEEDIRLIEKLLYDNSSPRPPEEFVSDNSDAKIKSFSPSPIPIKDSDSHMEEIDLSLNPVEPNSRDFTMDVVEDISPKKEPQVLTILPTHPTLQLNLKFQPSGESLFAYVVWIFLPFLVYSVVPCYLLSLQNEDIIFDPGICKYHFSKPDISHWCGTVKKFNTHHSHLNTFLMLIHGKNIPLLDVPLFHFYPP
nr:hypothetical protein [Tanacetum cinerariifolium]